MVVKRKRTRIEIDGKWYVLKANGTVGVELTRNDGWMTESEFFSMIRSALRGTTRFWKPKLRYMEEHHRPYKGKDKRIKKEYQCEDCEEWFTRSNVEMDHVTGAGSLKYFDDLPGFAERLFIEYNGGWRLLCKPCHKGKK